MKRLLFLLLIPLQAFAQENIGRFQIAVAQDPSGYHTLYKVDTETGKVWIYAQRLDKDKGRWISEILFSSPEKDEKK